MVIIEKVDNHFFSLRNRGTLSYNIPSPKFSVFTSMPLDSFAIKNFFDKITEPFLDFLYPPMCRGCGEAIHYKDVLCPECMNDLIEFEWDAGHIECVKADLHVSLDASDIRVGYVFEADGVLQDCVHSMKYQGMYSIALWFGRLVGERLVETNFIKDNPYLIPVPLHKIKQIERGYNQSEWLCKGVAHETGLQVLTNCLSRNRYTKSQAQSKLHADERSHNVRDAFVVTEEGREKLNHSCVILVDDLITTGATTQECIKALNEANVKEVRVLALATPAGKKSSLEEELRHELMMREETDANKINVNS